ncbi:MAG: zinc ABC transporter ATP-binding protein ZnuC [Alphaproteobacteria bacterium]|nr:zinc ABC transporter ATP-binding protein ZnuC [Alphaproteobacteria bacterium]MBF0251025.1 zinc ABC transporter ATP-binding protein ZnuC [Alphaproteobacteria bacterium]
MIDRAAEPLLLAEGVEVAFGGNIVLRGADAVVRPREIVTLIGPNGAGKTTLVRAMLGLVKPGKGRVQRRPGLRIGYMPQRLHIDPSLPMTVRRFLELGGRARPGAVDAILGEVGAGHVLSSPMQGLSGGEMQRVMLARALLREPDLLVLDEPVQGVDISGQAELYRLIQDIRATRGVGVLMVSHDLHVVMAKTDHVVCLNRHVCCAGHPRSVSRDPQFVALFGAEVASTLAVYAHHHDHHHDLDGHVVHDGGDGHEHGEGCDHG